MEETTKKKGIAGSTLKLIAVITMLIDHIGAGPFLAVVVRNPENFADGRVKMTVQVVLYYTMRCVGRLAFPIFIFLLIEGYIYTRNRWKYLLRLLLFALISEIPFDLAFNIDQADLSFKGMLEFGYQNVYFTLAVGLFTVILIDTLWHTSYEKPVRIACIVIFTAGGFEAAELLKTDYAGWGVLAIVASYLLRNGKPGLRMAGAPAILSVMQLAGGSLPSEAFSFLDILPGSFYNGTRGLKTKWLFYAFYPVHLLILGLIKLAIVR